MPRIVRAFDREVKHLFGGRMFAQGLTIEPSFGYNCSPVQLFDPSSSGPGAHP